MATKTADYKAGDKLRLKSTETTRQYGHHCWSRPQGCPSKINAGEVGTLEEHQTPHGRRHMYLAFSGGRTMAAGTLYDGNETWDFSDELDEYFVRVES